VPELDSITIKGFKSIALIDVDLRPINVVIGPNGSGKSNFIGAFSFLHALREGRLQEHVVRSGGADALLYFGSKVTEQMAFHLSFQSGVNQYTVVLTPGGADQLFPTSETAGFWNKAKYPDRGPYETILYPSGGEAGISAGDSGRVAQYVRAHLNSWRAYHFHDTSAASPMKRTQDVEDNRFLRPDGSNLAAFLYFLRLKHESSYHLIRRSIQRVAPFFDDFALEPQSLNQEKIRLEWRHRHSDAYFGAASLSDGTLRFIALATLFFQPETYRPSVILVDEPELGLHPSAITMLAALIKQASLTTQVIVSTQSPLLLDNFQPEDVLVADLIDDATQLRRLESGKLEHWLKDYSLGQLWEKNEFGGRPGAV